MDHSTLCVTVTAATMAELRRRRDSCPAGALVELRLDGVDHPDVAGALEGRRGPVLVTCRPVSEGGRFEGSEEERLRLLEAALEAGAEYVDVEWRALTPAFAGGGQRQRLVVSMHDFAGVPRDLDDRVAAMSATSAGVVKVAVTAHRLVDNLPLLDIARRRGAPTVALAMGEAGLPSRVLARRFGSAWTYASLDAPVAPGQPGVARLLGEYRFAALGTGTALYGVVGRPVAHSVSPAMHNAAFAAQGRDAVYLPLAAADFTDFLTFADALQVEGASVTAPYKLDAFHASRVVDEAGRQTGAVNTLKRAADGWDSRNTDVAGFLAPLEGRMPLDGVRVTVLGAGGAARGVAAGLVSRGAVVTIAARRADAARAVATAAGASAGNWPPAAGSWDVLVNSTPVGTWPDVEFSPLAADRLSGRLVYDLVYNPPRTRLLTDAAARGLDTIGGLDMLVAQAQEQAVWWTGIRPDATIMRDAARARLNENRHP